MLTLSCLSSVCHLRVFVSYTVIHYESDVLIPICYSKSCVEFLQRHCVRYYERIMVKSHITYKQSLLEIMDHESGVDGKDPHLLTQFKSSLMT